MELLSFRRIILYNQWLNNRFEEIYETVIPSTKAITETIKTINTVTKDTAVINTVTGSTPTVVTKPMTATDRSNPSTKNWTYNNVTANDTGTANYSHYYRDDNGNYYVMHKWNTLYNSSTGTSNVRAIGYIDNNGITWYLTSNGVSQTYDIITSNTATIWNGTLYKGWTYTTHSSTDSEGNTSYQCYGFNYGDEDAAVEKQWYYLHTDGDYYPVRRASNLSDGNGNNNVYAAWVIINGTRYYLHGEKLDKYGYDTSMTNQYRGIWFKPLYKGGWSYSTIIAANVADSNNEGHYYMDPTETNGKYYPVYKSTEIIDGITTYQAYIEIPNVGKRYLYGTTHLSVDPCPFSTKNGIFFFFGNLYKGGWTYNNTTVGTGGTKHYFLHTDGEYYPIQKETSTNNYQLYVTLLEGKRYLDGNIGLSETPYTASTTKYMTICFGTLYQMTGFSQADVKLGTSENGHHYKHTNNKYYPVLKETLTNDTTTYQLYVELPEGKRYLWGHTIHTDPCPYSITTNTVMYYGSLYTGGWTYSNMTVNDISHQGYSYLFTDGEYYPIFRETVSIDGTTTYQDYITPADGNKYYLCGNDLSLNPYQYAIATTTSKWFGPLYSGGWTSANLTPLSTAANGLFYLYNGNYYPIFKETLSNPTTYQLYVNTLSGKKYLYGTHLSDTPYPFSTRTNVAIFYGNLYTGGWTYNNLINGDADGGHFYYDRTTHKYYKIVKGTHKVGSTTYYHAQLGPDLDGNELPNGPWYLTGSYISNSYSPDYEKQAKDASLYFYQLYKLKDTT